LADAMDDQHVVQRKPRPRRVRDALDLGVGKTRIGLQLQPRHGASAATRDAGEADHRAGLLAALAEAAQQRAGIEGFALQPDHRAQPPLMGLRKATSAPAASAMSPRTSALSTAACTPA